MLLQIGLTTTSFPAFSGLFASLMAAAAAAPDDMPTCNRYFSLTRIKKKKKDISESEEQLWSEFRILYQQTFF